MRRHAGAGTSAHGPHWRHAYRRHHAAGDNGRRHRHRRSAWFPGVLVGAATQIELELLVEAGLKPDDALRAATINAARMIGKEQDLGTIEAGKAADLVILDADPRADVRNVTRINRT